MKNQVLITYATKNDNEKEGLFTYILAFDRLVFEYYVWMPFFDKNQNSFPLPRPSTERPAHSMRAQQRLSPAPSDDNDDDRFPPPLAACIPSPASSVAAAPEVIN